MIRQADDIYEVIAIILGMHDPANGPLKNNKPLRQKVKAMALGCQFGLGPDGFAAYSGMSLPEATDAVNLYQRRMRTITQFWDQLREDMVMSSSLGEPLRIELPSGRVMDYGIPRKMKTVSSTGKLRFAHVGKMVRNGQLRDFRLWHGLLAENCAQGLARDIFSEMLLRIDEAGHDIILHVHDEVVIECDAEEAEKVLAECLEIMSTPPAWIPDIPLSAEGEILDFYSK
jgi:DNA polymerase